MTKQITIRTNDHDVLAAGKVLSFDMTPVEFVVAEEPNLMIVRCVIEKDNESESGGIRLSATEESRLDIIMTNPHVKSNFGPDAPIMLGTLENRQLHATFRVTPFGNSTSYSSFEVTYAFYLTR